MRGQVKVTQAQARKMLKGQKGGVSVQPAPSSSKDGWDEGRRWAATHVLERPIACKCGASVLKLYQRSYDGPWCCARCA